MLFSPALLIDLVSRETKPLPIMHRLKVAYHEHWYLPAFNAGGELIGKCTDVDCDSWLPYDLIVQLINAKPPVRDAAEGK